MKIRAYVNYDERRKIHYYKDFEIIKELPKEGDEYDYKKVIKVYQIMLDSEQGDDDIYDYDFFEITLSCVENDEEEQDIVYIAIEKEIVEEKGE